jgi:hypothetical protein
MSAAARRSLSTLLCLHAMCLATHAAQALPERPAQLYRLTTQTGMPHLEENLRYAVVHETRCVDPRDLSSLFWMLRHEALQGCRLDKHGEGAGAARYLLRCDGRSETTGSAEWQLEPGRLAGTLDVKLGGKNMTFWQRISGSAVGPCP